MKYGVYTKYRYFVTYFTQPRAAFHAASAFCTRTKKSPSNQNLPYMMLKTRFPFLYASTSLDTKTLTIALNFNFESYTTIRCLAPQHVLRFFHFWRGFFLSLWNFAHYCVFLLNAPLSDRDEKKKHLCSGLLLPGNLDPSSLSPGGPIVLLVCGFRRRDNNLLA